MTELSFLVGLLVAIFITLLIIGINVYYDAKELLKTLQGIRADLRILRAPTDGGQEECEKPQ